MTMTGIVFFLMYMTVWGGWLVAWVAKESKELTASKDL